MGFAMHRSHLNPLDPMAFVAFLDLAIRQTLSPAEHRPTASPRWRIPTAEHLEESRFVARKGIGAHRRSMSLTKTTLGILHQRQRLLRGPFAHS